MDWNQCVLGIENRKLGERVLATGANVKIAYRNQTGVV